MANRGDALRVQLDPRLCPTSVALDGMDYTVQRIIGHRPEPNDRDVWRVDVAHADGPTRLALIQHDLVTGNWVLLHLSEER